MAKMEQSTLNNFFPVRKRSGADLGRKRKRTESSREATPPNFSKSCSEPKDKTVCLGDKNAGKRVVVTPTSALSPLRAGSRGIAMLRLAQQKSKTPRRSMHPAQASDIKPQPQSSSKSESPQLQRFRAVEFVSPKKRCVSCNINHKTFILRPTSL